ncbi:hypothetical protein BC938DRAFT_483798 [Jimgerdemannia flammicorona]|uniref:Uncharacterized protein n=1 Tax=Jimgerdemannia flammicorona TaxID=994334 RepID=A0A433QB77_9FUNG|nr:hypothetical protein BC938DRAFT_483798 [Jimgerdemannia flammicorona]
MQLVSELQQLFRGGYGGVSIDLPRLASRVTISDDLQGIVLPSAFEEEPSPTEGVPHSESNSSPMEVTVPAAQRKGNGDRVLRVITVVAELLEGEERAAEMFTEIDSTCPSDGVSEISDRSQGQRTARPNRRISHLYLRSVLEIGLGQYSRTSQTLKFVQQNTILMPMHYLRLTFPILSQPEYLVKDVRRPDGWRISIHFLHSDPATPEDLDELTAFDSHPRPTSVTVTHSRREQAINAEKYFEIEWSISLHLALSFSETSRRVSVVTIDSLRSEGGSRLEQRNDVRLSGYDLVISRVSVCDTIPEETKEMLRQEFVSKEGVIVQEVVMVPATELVDMPPVRPRVIESQALRNPKRCCCIWFACSHRKRRT